MPTNYQIRKSDNNITLFEIYPNSGGEAVSVAGGVIELYYYENILSETIRVTASIVDTGNVSGADDGSGGKIGGAGIEEETDSVDYVSDVESEEVDLD